MSETIYAAIARAIGLVSPIAHDARNSQGSYDYTSIDAFLAMTGPVCAQCGLFVNLKEIEVAELTRKGRNGDTFWGRYTFEATVYHQSGEALPLGERTVEVIRNGPQASQAAHSFALKNVLRVLLQIPTGDHADKIEDYGLKGVKPDDGKNFASEGIKQAHADAVADGLANNVHSKRTLSKARGEAILAALADCDTEEAFMEYVDTLEPHEAKHEKIAPEITAMQGRFGPQIPV